MQAFRFFLRSLCSRNRGTPLTRCEWAVEESPLSSHEGKVGFSHIKGQLIDIRNQCVIMQSDALRQGRADPPGCTNAEEPQRKATLSSQIIVSLTR